MPPQHSAEDSKDFIKSRYSDTCWMKLNLYTQDIYGFRWTIAFHLQLLSLYITWERHVGGGKPLQSRNWQLLLGVEVGALPFLLGPNPYNVYFPSGFTLFPSFSFHLLVLFLFLLPVLWLRPTHSGHHYLALLTATLRYSPVLYNSTWLNSYFPEYFIWRHKHAWVTQIFLSNCSQSKYKDRYVKKRMMNR